VRKVVQKRIRRSADGVNVVADVNAVVAASVGKKESTTGATTRQSVSIVQRNGRTEVTEEHSEG
jgi:hypothetical protein